MKENFQMYEINGGNLARNYMATTEKSSVVQIG